MAIGLKLWSTNFDNYSKEALRLFNMGFCSYVELYVVPGTLETLSFWKKLRLPFTLHCPHFAQGFNLSKPELREHNRLLFDEVRRFADELDVDYIVVHGGIGGDVLETAKQLKNLKDNRVLIENKPYKSVPAVVKDKICVGYCKEELELIKNESGCGFCLDFVHAICAANSLNKECYGYIDSLMSLKPNMFHLTDMHDIKSEFDSHLHLGVGEVDVPRISSFIPYDGKVTLETAKNSKTSLEDFIQDSNLFKAVIKPS